MKQTTTSFFHRSLHRLARLLLTGLPASVVGADTAHPDAAWVSSWIASPQPPMPGSTPHYHAQSLRLIVHTSAGGSQVRIRLSNLYGNTPLMIGAAHIACRTHDADIDPSSDRALAFGGHPAISVPAHATVLSDPVNLQIPALADLSISLYLPNDTAATTLHILARQTSYVSHAGNVTAAAHFPAERRIGVWPFLTGVDVVTRSPTFAVVAFGDSTVDGDGSTPDANGRWPDALAARLQQAGRNIAVLNAGLIGNRLLHGSPGGKLFGDALGEAGLARFSRDALDQVGAKVVIARIGGNDLGFIDVLARPGEKVTANDLIAGYQHLIASAHQRGLRILGTTNPPFEGADLPGYSTPTKDAIRQQVNTWIRNSGAFDAMLDFDQVVRDPAHPARLLPAYDSGDHLHPNDAGYRAVASALSLETLDRLASSRVL